MKFNKPTTRMALAAIAAGCVVSANVRTSRGSVIPVKIRHTGLGGARPLVEERKRYGDDWPDMYGLRDADEFAMFILPDGNVKTMSREALTKIENVESWNYIEDTPYHGTQSSRSS